ncbi:MAG: DUF1559 domain-containing protein [Pirellulales bacterium]
MSKLAGTSRKRLRWAAGIGLVLMLLTCVVPPAPLDVAFNLLFGWVPFALGMLEDEPAIWRRLLLGVAATFVLFVAQRLLVRLAPRSSLPLSLGLAAAVLIAVASFAALRIAQQTLALAQSPDPLLVGVWRATRRIQSVNSLREITSGAATYGDVHGQPPFAGALDPGGRGQHGWLTHLLPHVERQDLYDRVDFRRPWTDRANAEVFRTPVRPYRMLFEPEYTSAGYGIAHYSLNALLVRPIQPPRAAAYPDGAAQTILAGEVIKNVPAWGYHANWRDPTLGLNRSPQGFGSPHHGGVNVSFADGGVKFLNDDIDPQVLRALSTPDGGERVQDEPRKW